MPVNDYDWLYAAAAKDWNLDPLWLKAIAGQETRGNPRLTSPAGAQGLMQIMPETQRALGVEDPFDPAQSIYGGAKYLSEAIEKEGQNANALLYYHGGPGWRNSYGPESRAYAPAVIARYQALIQAASKPYVIGDSIARGLQQAGKFDGSAQEGLSPQDVYNRINGITDSILGRPVILSSGISNAPSQQQLDMVRSQIEQLQRRGASQITLMGIGDRQDFAGLNDGLSQVAQDMGVQFAGPIPPDMLAGDRVHPKTYQPLLSSVMQPQQTTAQAGQ